MNADPKVMPVFPESLFPCRIEGILLRSIRHRPTWVGTWVVEVDGVFAGFTGLFSP